MRILNVETAFIVGAGFSYHAGLPLTDKFTEAILEARTFHTGPSRILVDFLSRFIHDAFDHSKKSKAASWPQLEDIFTCIDLSANSGHHLGPTFAPADLRAARRAILSRILRMLDQKYDKARKAKGSDWRKLDDFFWHIDLQKVGFISMNWDTVIERKLALASDRPLIDYCCDASPAIIPAVLDEFEFSSRRAYLKEVEKGQIITLAPLPIDRRRVDKSLPIIKIHGSANWLYCDNCRQLFWFDPGQTRRIADQLVKKDDVERMRKFLLKKVGYADQVIENLSQKTQVNCLCSGGVALGTRIATFSYRKALDFPMFQKSWSSAEELLRAADRWVFIGYSLPAADFEFKYLLKRTQLSRRKQPEFIIVSGGTPASVNQTYDNYRRFFGRVVNKSRFFSSGLGDKAVAAISR
jgi:hypothetical protein